MAVGKGDIFDRKAIAAIPRRERSEFRRLSATATLVELGDVIMCGGGGMGTAGLFEVA